VRDIVIVPLVFGFDMNALQQVNDIVIILNNNTIVGIRRVEDSLFICLVDSFE